MTPSETSSEKNYFLLNAHICNQQQQQQQQQQQNGYF
jgi:hypothetical protein